MVDDSRPVPPLSSDELAWVGNVLRRLWRTAVVAGIFLIVPTMLGAPWSKAAITATVAALMTGLRFGGRIAQGSAILLAVYAAAVWYGAAPSPSTLSHIGERLLAWIG